LLFRFSELDCPGYYPATQPDMMNVMMTYNPVLFLLFTASWTAGMAEMMFPAIVPLVLL
jgi:hypothetical protein